MKSVKDNSRFRYIILLLLLLVQAGRIVAQNIPARPDPPRLVNDFADMLSPSEEQQLEQKLDAYADSTSTQIAIVTITTLEGAPVQEYAAQLGYKWGVGQKDKHNGVVILISKQDRKGYIATGYGVEDGLNANICKQIYQTVLVPELKNGNYYAAFDATTNSIFDVLAGKFVNENPSSSDNEGSVLVPILIFIAVFIFIIIMSRRNQSTISRRGIFYPGGFPFIGGGSDWGGSGGSDSGGGFGGFGGDCTECGRFFCRPHRGRDLPGGRRPHRRLHLHHRHHRRPAPDLAGDDVQGRERQRRRTLYPEFSFPLLLQKCRNCRLRVGANFSQRLDHLRHEVLIAILQQFNQRRNSFACLFSQQA